MTIPEMIQGVQKSLGVDVDGVAGPQTWVAIYNALAEPEALVIPANIGGPVDARSLKNIETLLPEVRPYALALVNAAKEQGITIKVISGTRTYAEQDALYDQGRTKPGPRVTNARAGFSNHNFGLAFDCGVFEGATYKPESPLYKVVGSIGKSLGLEWGGSWASFSDEPHFQLRPQWATGENESKMLAELRQRKEAGLPVFV